MEKIRIMIILPSYGGGAEKVAANIFNSLDDSYDKHLVFMTKVCSVPDFNTGSVHRLGGQTVKNSIFKLDKIINKFKPAIVFSTNEHVSVFVYLLKKIRNYNYKHVVRLPTLPSNKLSHKLKSKIVSFLYSYTLREGAGVICQSKRMYDECLAVFNTNPKKTHNFPNYVDKLTVLDTANRTFKIENFGHSKNIVYVGSIYPVKGLDVLLEAYAELEIEGLALHIIGEFKNDIKYNLLIKNKIEELKRAHKNIYMYGFINNPYPYIKHADLLVLPSRYEGFPNVVLESLLLGTPVVATLCTDFSQIKAKTSCIYVEVDNQKSLQTGIIEGLKRLEVNDFIYNNINYNLFFKGLL